MSNLEKLKTYQKDFVEDVHLLKYKVGDIVEYSDNKITRTGIIGDIIHYTDSKITQKGIKKRIINTSYPYIIYNAVITDEILNGTKEKESSQNKKEFISCSESKEKDINYFESYIIRKIKKFQLKEEEGIPISKVWRDVL